MDKLLFSLKSNVNKFFDLPPEKSAADYILRKCEQFSACGLDRPCITNPITEDSIRYSEVTKFSGNVANFLVENGFQAGDIIINTSHNGAKLHAFFIGVWRAGGIIQCSYPEDVGDFLADLIVKSQAKFVVCDEPNIRACLFAASHQTTVLVFDEAMGCVSLNHLFTENLPNRSFREVQVERGDTALLLPTSGTTGISKFVVYTHETLIRNIIMFEHFPFTQDPSSPFLITGKQTHFTGSVCPLAMMTSGRNLFMMTQVNLKNILLTVQKFKIKSIFSFPSYLTGLILDPEASDFDCSSIEFVFTAGMVVGPSFSSTVRKLPNVKRVIVIYGMTEAGFLTSNVDWTETDEGIRAIITGSERSVSVGKLPPGASVCVRDIDSGRFVERGRKGELCFKNDLVCTKYWRNSQETKTTFEDGWIFTGDLGFYDEYGNIYVLNRVKDVFKYFNNHISPSEIENVILEHPAVEQACVVGIPDPNGGGSIPRAFVTLRENYIRGQDKELDNILNHANDKLASYKKLRGGLFALSKFPKGKNGKILRAALCELDISKISI